MNKRRITLGIVGILCLSLNTSTLAYASQSEKSVPKDLENHWSKTNVEELISKDVIGGYPDGTFRPDEEITVAEFVKILMINNQIELGEKGTNWYDEYINGARKLGLIQGGEITDYNRPINRVEMTKMIDRALNLEDATPNPFLDHRKFGANHRAISRVSSIGVIGGYPDGTFKPYANATRGEASTMIKRINDHLDGKVVVPNVKVIPEYNEDGSWTDEWFLSNLGNIKKYTNFDDYEKTVGTYKYDGKKMIVASNDRSEVEFITIEDEVINERILKVLKYFTQTAYETNRYARVNMRGGDNHRVVIDFSSKHNIFNVGDFEIQFPLYPETFTDDFFINQSIVTKQRVDVRWNIGKMFDFRSFPRELGGDDILEYDYLVEHEYILEPYKEVMNGTFKLMYGDDYKDIMDYIVKERLTEIRDVSHENYSQVEINGIKIHNENDRLGGAAFQTELK